MRGKELLERRGQGWLRITPAYAGKRYCSRKTGTSNRDHPRLCGEKGVSFTYAETFAGITPAYAGKRRFVVWI